MEELLDALLRECQPYTAHGKVATYIPELAKGDPSDLGIYVLRSDGRHYQAGSYRKHFTIKALSNRSSCFSPCWTTARR